MSGPARPHEFHRARQILSARGDASNLPHVFSAFPLLELNLTGIDGGNCEVHPLKTFVKQRPRIAPGPLQVEGVHPPFNGERGLLSAAVPAALLSVPGPDIAYSRTDCASPLWNRPRRCSFRWSRRT